MGVILQNPKVFKVNHVIGIDLSIARVIYAWDVDLTTDFSKIYKGRLYRLRGKYIPAIDRYFKSFALSPLPAAGSKLTEKNDRFMAKTTEFFSVTGLSGGIYIQQLKAFEVNSLPYGGKSKVSVGDNGILTADVISVRIPVAVDIYSGNTRTGNINAFAHFSAMDSKFNAITITKDEAEPSWDGLDIRLSPENLNTGTAADPILVRGTTSNEMTISANSSPLLTRLKSVLQEYEWGGNPALPKYFPEKGPAAHSANAAAGSVANGASLDGAIIQFALTGTFDDTIGMAFPAVKISEFQTSDNPLDMGYKYEGFVTQGCGYNNGQIVVFGDKNTI